MDLSSCSIESLSLQNAVEITRWRYDPPYDIYNVLSTQDALNEVLKDEYYAVLDNRDIIGYFCLGSAGQVPGGQALGLYDDGSLLDIGLGLRPDLVGQSYGLKFLQLCLSFADDRYKPEGFRLSVAAFNKRAISVYRKAGFVKVAGFASGEENTLFDFWLMIRNLSG
jgi:RimJ/RimL family protein N-acetyltransferase